MNKEQKENITVRAISVGFAVLALGVFKPFGLGAWQWEAYVHLLAVYALGFIVCMFTDIVLKYIVKMPRSRERGVGYIIRRNLWFQLINTPLISLMICLYRHFMLSDRVPANHLSWRNFFETLVIMAFICFAIGLYWRFKFRSRYLAMELEETRQLNEILRNSANAKQPLAAVPNTITLTGSTSETVTLQIEDLLYIEVIGNYVKVCHLKEGEVHTDMLRNTSKQIEEQLQQCETIVRCHRSFLINISHVEQIVSKSGSMQLQIRHCNDMIPVSRSKMSQMKEIIRGKKY